MNLFLIVCAIILGFICGYFFAIGTQPEQPVMPQYYQPELPPVYSRSLKLNVI